MKSGERLLLDPLDSPGATPAPLGESGSFGRAERGFYAWLVRTLSHPRADRWVICAAILAASPAIFSGIAADDHIHRLSLRGAPGMPDFQRPVYDLFRFADPRWNQSLIDQGIFPWWADPQTHLAFFRPLTSLTHALDHWAFTDDARLSHVQSLAWFLLALLAVRKLYAEFFGPGWLATLALFFYGLDDARSGPITWLANRNALIGCSLSLWSLVYFRLWRTRGRGVWFWLSLASLAAALTAGEGALAIFAYFVAYALCLDGDDWVKRGFRLLPFASILVAWRVLSVALGYGSLGSGVYLDPAHDLGSFLRALPIRMAALLLGQVAGPWSEMWNFAAMLSRPTERVLFVFALVVLAIIARLIAPLWRDKELRFWVIGALLATLPSCATFPADRLLFWTAIGASAAVAIVFDRLIQPAVSGEAWPGSPALARAAALSVVGFHLILGPLMLPWRSTGIVAIRTMLSRGNDSLPKTPDISDKTFVYVNPPADPFAGYIPIMRADMGVPRPALQRWLGTGNADLEIERIDGRTLRVRQAGGYLAAPSETMLRGSNNPFHVGDKVTVPGMTAEILRLTDDARPLEVKIQFAVPLEDPKLCWFYWDQDRFSPFTLPRLGETVRIPQVNFMKVAYGRGS